MPATSSRRSELEHRDVVFMSDQEASLGDFLQEVVKRRGDAKTFVEQSPVTSSASNGVIEPGMR